MGDILVAEPAGARVVRIDDGSEVLRIPAGGDLATSVPAAYILRQRRRASQAATAATMPVGPQPPTTGGTAPP